MKKPASNTGDSKKSSPKTSTASKTSTATRTATATKTSTDAYTQGNITVTGGAGAGDTHVTIGLPGGSLANNAKEPSKAKGNDSKGEKGNKSDSDNVGKSKRHSENR